MQRLCLSSGCNILVVLTSRNRRISTFYRRTTSSSNNILSGVCTDASIVLERSIQSPVFRISGRAPSLVSGGFIYTRTKYIYMWCYFFIWPTEEEVNKDPTVSPAFSCQLSSPKACAFSSKLIDFLHGGRCSTLSPQTEHQPKKTSIECNKYYSIICRINRRTTQ